MFDLAFVVVLSILAAGAGLRLLRALDSLPEHPGDALALALPIGLGGLGLAALGLGEVGWLGRPGLLVVLAGFAAVGGRDAIRGLDRWWGAARSAARDWGPIEAIAALGLVGTLLTALAPVTDGDALCYHLQVPKLFLLAGSVGFEPDLHETVYPLLVELLYAVALAFRGPVACRLLQWMLGLAFAGIVTALARPFLGARARWAGAIALLAPAISNGMTAPLNDVALAAYGNAAILAWTRQRESGRVRSTVLLGICAGLAIGVKYPALVLAGLIGLALLVAGRGGTRRRVGDAALYGLIAVLVGGCWYLRAYHFTGNPVFPFFRQVFGGSGLDEVLDPIKRPMDPSPWNVLTALGPLSLQPDRFDSFSHQFGPIFLLFLPALLIERAPRRLLAIVAIGYAFLMLCFTQRQSMRFLLVSVGPMAVGVAWLARAWLGRRSVPARALVGLLVAALALEAGLALARSRRGLPVVLGLETVGRYLDRHEPTHRVGRWIDANLPADARLIGQDHRGFYLPRPYTMELAHRRRTGLAAGGEDAEAIVDVLSRRGFTHLMLCPPDPEDAVEFDPTLGNRLRPWTDRRRPLYRESLADADGVVRRFSIYELAPAESGPSFAGVAR